MLLQDIPYKRIILWLAQEEFPLGELNLPKKLVNLTGEGLIIKWCHNYGPYKKLIPALKEFPEDLIVTADDDVIYPRDWLRRLVKSYLKYPDDIHCLRAHKLKIRDGKILKYCFWDHLFESDVASALIFPTGVGGVLYRRSLLYSDIFDENTFMKICHNADDIWFWAMALLQGSKIRIASPTLKNPSYVPGTQDGDTPLWKKNMGSGNDVAINNILTRYPELLEILQREDEADLKDNSPKNGIDLRVFNRLLIKFPNKMRKFCLFILGNRIN